MGDKGARDIFHGFLKLISDIFFQQPSPQRTPRKPLKLGDLGDLGGFILVRRQQYADFEKTIRHLLSKRLIIEIKDGGTPAYSKKNKQPDKIKAAMKL